MSDVENEIEESGGSNVENLETSMLYLSEEIEDDIKEKNYIRRNLEGEFEPDFSEEYED